MRKDIATLVSVVRQLPTHGGVLGWARYHLFLPKDRADRLQSPGRQVPFLLALLVGTPEPADPRAVDESLVREVNDLLDRIFFAYANMFFVGLKNESAEWNEAANVAMPAFLHYFNQGTLETYEQVKARVTGLFVPLDDNLEETLGITASQTLTVISHIEEQLLANEENWRRLQAEEREARHKLLDRAMAEGWTIEKVREEAERSGVRDLVMRLFGGIDDLLVVRRDELREQDPDLADRYWDLFVVRRGESDTPAYITDALVTDRRCLFEVERGVALVLSANSLYSAAAYVFEEALHAGSMRSRFLRRRDEFLEDRLEEAVRRFFPAESTIVRAACEDANGQHEHDLVVVHGGSLFIFEAKASPPREPFRDPLKAVTRIADHFGSDAGIQHAADQAERVLARLRRAEVVELFDSKGKPALRLDPGEIKETFAVCVTAADFGVMAVDLALLLKKSDEAPYPWAVCIAALESIFTGWAYREWGLEKLKDYLTARAELHGRVSTFDELEIAGAMLTHGSIEHLVQADCDRVHLNEDYAEIFDKIEAALAGGPSVEFEDKTPVFADLREMLRQALAERASDTSGPRKVRKVGRNEPCPCGSGRKYKKCCGKPG